MLTLSAPPAASWRATATPDELRERPLAAAPDAGIGVALRCLARDFLTRRRIECGVHLSHEPLWFDASRVSLLVRIVDAALDNIARHAAASRVDIVLLCQEDHYLLKLRDNGRGFHPPTEPRQGSGLASMHRWAQMLGGTFEAASSPGRGTILRVRFPLS